MMKKAYSLLSFAAMGSFLMGTARAGDHAKDCAQAYETAQEEKSAARLANALVHLKACIAVECPAFIREDCMRWLAQTESALPTVVFSVDQDGADLTEVEVLCDHKPLTRKLDGKALPMDPGPHAFSFKVPGHVTVERKILAREGERNRMIKVTFSSATKLLPPSEASSGSGQAMLQAESTPPSSRLMTYAFAGVGVLGFAGFTTFAILGDRQAGDLERTCAPNCLPGQVDSVKTKYHIADASLGVGLISLGVATFLWVRSRGKEDGKEDKERQFATAIGFLPRSAGGVLQLSTSY